MKATSPNDASDPRKRTTRIQRRLALLDAMADHLLAQGLSGSPLRALAVAAGTSDRMLLYYFADREELLTALLEHIAGRLSSMLNAGRHEARVPYNELLAQLWSLARQPLVRPFMLLFLELAASAGRGEEPHRTAAGRIARDFTLWIGERLLETEEERPARAAMLLAHLDGLFLLYSAGCGTEANAAAELVTGIEP